MNILRNTFLFTSLGVASIATAQISVSLAVDAGGFSNSQGDATNEMPFGILIDTADDGFDEGFYNAFDFSTSGQFLYSSGTITDDWFVFPGANTPETAFSPSLGDGAIGTVVNLTLDNAMFDKDFSVIWFENIAKEGEAYGIAVDPDFVIPSSGFVSYAPVKPWTPGSADYTLLAAVPEPNVIGALLGVGVLGLALVRRRR